MYRTIFHMHLVLGNSFFPIPSDRFLGGWDFNVAGDIPGLLLVSLVLF
jgi:hypothetical protein